MDANSKLVFKMEERLNGIGNKSVLICPVRQVPLAER
jgi:hypothetical protein